VTGSTIGPYRILAKLGEGGMGEVYRARDTKLDRDVAIKVLPDAIASDADRLARFEREARALAALNHPNIASIYAIEASGARHAIVMELVEGADLSARISTGPVPLQDALAIARQIALALEAAHEQHIVHRDLKPANIKVREDDAVKVLDFGLAKALEPPGKPDVDTMNSPTLTARGTHMGVILGTAAYMSPEQAKGKAVDKRADVWAFGVVLFEMLAGKRPFEGDDVTEVLAAVVRAEPDWAALPKDTPPLVRRLVERCLSKDVKQRLHDIADARLDIEEAIAPRSGGVENSLVAPASRQGVASSWRWLAALATIVALAATGAAVWMFNRQSVQSGPAEYDVALPAEAPIVFGKGSPWGEAWRSLAISPNGDFVVYIAGHGDGTQLWYRSLTNSTARAMPNTDGAYQLAVSPDGASVAFIAGSTVKIAEIGNSTIVELGNVVRPEGVGWRSSTQVVVHESSALREFTLSGASRKVNMKAICYNLSPFTNNQAVCGGHIVNVLNLDDGNLQPARSSENPSGSGGGATTRGSAPEVLGAGYILMSSRTGLLIAAHWHAATSTLSDQTTLPLQIRTEGLTGSRQAAVSQSGTLAYVPGGYAGQGSLVSRNPASQATPVALPIPPMIVGQFDLDHDGRRLAVTSARVDGMALTVHDLRTGRSNVWLQGYESLSEPRWNPDGTRLAVLARKAETDADVTLIGNPASSVAPVPVRGAAFAPSHWYDPTHLLGSTDGLVDVQIQGEIATVHKLDVRGSRGMKSPDGRLVAYISGDDVFVEAVGGSRTRERIARGLDPMWADNRTLVYHAGKSWFRATIDADGSVGATTLWFSDEHFVDTLNRSQTLARDGGMIYVTNDMKDSATFLRVIPRWTASVAAAVDTKTKR
jgi:hypothetical protein